MVFRWLFMVIRLCTATSLDGWAVPGVLAWVSAPGGQGCTLSKSSKFRGDTTGLRIKPNNQEVGRT